MSSNSIHVSTAFFVVFSGWGNVLHSGLCASAVLEHLLYTCYHDRDRWFFCSAFV